MKAISVAELYSACKYQISKGNGDKIVLISSDDEGNSFHKLFLTFTDNVATISNLKYALPFETDPNNVVLLG